MTELLTRVWRQPGIRASFDAFLYIWALILRLKFGAAILPKHQDSDPLAVMAERCTS